MKNWRIIKGQLIVAQDFTRMKYKLLRKNMLKIDQMRMKNCAKIWNKKWNFGTTFCAFCQYFLHSFSLGLDVRFADTWRSPLDKGLLLDRCYQRTISSVKFHDYCDYNFVIVFEFYSCSTKKWSILSLISNCEIGSYTIPGKMSVIFTLSGLGKNRLQNLLHIKTFKTFLYDNRKTYPHLVICLLSTWYINKANKDLDTIYQTSY